MWYISFSGGPKGVNNIRVYHDSGHPHAQPDLLPTGKSDPSLQELRGFAVAGSLLYVANAYHRYSQILVYTADEDRDYRFKVVFASRHTVNSLVHPYDLTFDPQGNCYASSQDTNVVTGLRATGSALEVAPYLQQQYPPPAGFLAGTFVASASGDLPGIPSPGIQPPPEVAAPQGLEASLAGHAHRRVAHSVRGLLFHQGYLYVADEPANAVKVYAGHTGELHGQIAGGNLRSPDQLLLEATTGVLYIGSSDSDRVVSYDLAQGAPAGTVQPRTFIHGGVKHVSGMAFDPDGYFYAAERKAKRIKRFPPDGRGSGKDFIAGLPDEPEFIRYVPRRG
jgi:hypothetical protein